MRISFKLKTEGPSDRRLILMVCTWSGNRISVSTGEYAPVDHWNGKQHRCEQGTRFPEGNSINEYLDHLALNTMTKYRRFLMAKDREPNRSEMKDIYQGDKSRKLNDFLSWIDRYVEESGNRVNHTTGKKLRPGTLMIYRRVVKRLHDYNLIRPLNWDTLDEEFYRGFVDFLSKRYARNTVGKVIILLKGFLRAAESVGMPVHPYYKGASFRGMNEATSRIHLTPEELAKWKSAKLPSPQMEEIRDIFLVSCYSGLRFSDWHKLPESLSMFPGYIALRRQTKTGTPAYVPIHPDIADICAGFQNGFQYRTRFINQMVNVSLKAIGKHAGLDAMVKQEITRNGVLVVTEHPKYKLIMTHTGRRTFATNTYQSGFDVKALSVIMGFTSEKELIRYLKIGDVQRAQMLQKHWQQLQS